ncbi:MAG: DUF11 domain-containing protein [Candidatus Nomurabacteria bacterium]|jgi:uncharacterized repeat protein (TIGR01451 family)|nr:DUF11 domain-containing protein [Candidatus Nomurabacteria bacterium]
MTKKINIKKSPARKQVLKVQWHLHHKLAWLVVAGALLTTAIASLPSLISAWGPARTLYTLNQVNGGELGNTPVLNSIKDQNNIDGLIAEYNKTHPKQQITSWVGDETQFLNVKEKGASTDDPYNGWKSAEPNWKNPQVVEPGKTYRVRMFVHNNNPRGLNVVAQNVRAWVNMADASAETEKTITAYIGGSNTNEVYDEAKFTSTGGKKFNLAYIPGSVKYVNNWTLDQARTDFNYTIDSKTYKGYAPLSDYMFAKQGVLLGYDTYDADTLQFNGSIPGCYQYSGWIYFDLAAQFQDTVGIGVTKEVSKQGANDWQKSLKVNVGETVDFEIAYANRNTGGLGQYGVVIRDILPKGMELVPESTQYASADTQGEYRKWEAHSGNNNTITFNGINASDAKTAYAPTKDLSYLVKFSAKVSETVCGNNDITLTNIGRVSATTSDKRYFNDATADVIVAANECPPDVPPYTPDVPPTTPSTIAKTGAGATIAAIAVAAAIIVWHHFYVQQNKLKKPAHLRTAKSRKRK